MQIYSWAARKLSKKIRPLRKSFARRLLPWAMNELRGSSRFAGKPLIVIADDYGRLANRLIRLVNLAYIADELDATLIDATLVQCGRSFATPASKGCFVYNDPDTLPLSSRIRIACWVVRSCEYLPDELPQSISHLAKCVSAYIDRGVRVRIDRDQLASAIDSSPSQFVLVFALFFDAHPVDPHLVEKCRQLVSPSQTLDQRCIKIISDSSLEQAPSPTLVGVHIRQGDYRTWQGGRYYISPQEFAIAMRRIAAHLGPNTRFLVFSDEILDEAVFEGLDAITLRGSAEEDLFCLSRCSLIVSTFSTYAYFASFFASVPIADLSKVERGESFDPAKNTDLIQWPYLGTDASS